MVVGQQGRCCLVTYRTFQQRQRLSGLWVTDGTPGGTHELFAGGGGALDPHGLNPSDFTVFNGEVLLRGLDQFGRSEPRHRLASARPDDLTYERPPQRHKASRARIDVLRSVDYRSSLT